jgi:hypothetical protein
VRLWNWIEEMRELCVSRGMDRWEGVCTDCYSLLDLRLGMWVLGRNAGGGWFYDGFMERY